MMFGHSRGRFPVEREDELRFQFERLADATGQDTYFCEHVENDTFAVRSYYWGECDCGYDERWSEKEEKWLAAHPHAPGCYQTELDKETLEYDKASGYRRIRRDAFGDDESTLLGGMDIEFDTVELEPGVAVTTIVGHSRSDVAMERWREAYHKRNAFLDGLYARLCKKHKRVKTGCAIHCTCGRGEMYDRFAETDDHAPTCSLALPNFLFKPTGFELRWYKYPLRDSYSSEPVTKQMLRKMVNECIRSLGKNPEDH